MNESQKLVLQTNLARDKAEALLEGLRKAAQDAEARAAAEGESREQGELRRLIMARAMASAQRTVDSLNAALRIAEEGGLDLTAPAGDEAAADEDGDADELADELTEEDFAAAHEALEELGLADADELKGLDLGPLTDAEDEPPTGPA